MIETARLLLRLPEASDLDGFASFAADEATMAHLGGVKTRSEVWRGLCELRGAWAIRGFSMFSVIERATGAWVGRLGPWQPEGWPGTEIGWGVHPAFAGRGYAYEANCAAMDYAVDVLGWSDICHTIAPGNDRSIRLAQRLGSVNRGPTRLPPPYQDYPVDNWGQSMDQWRARRAARSSDV